MRNIFKIFMTDAKRLSTNVVAVVIIMGLAVIPCLYAWFNILSNWDPYSEDATKNISVAVASDDLGISIDDVKLNIGDKIIANLKENKAINWVFTDTSEDAINGVTAGHAAGCKTVMIPDMLTPDEETIKKTVMVCNDLIEARDAIKSGKI